MDKIRNEKEIDYGILKLIKEHSKKYDAAHDKKQFLKDVCAYEQKLILLNSDSPCDVLMYLAEIDTKATNLVINELTNQEILKILDSFTTEDKSYFYSNFKNLSLVNRFLTKDENSFLHIKDLSFDRKINLINSSNENTSSSASNIYDTLSNEEKEYVEENDLISDYSESQVLYNDVEEESQLELPIFEPIREEEAENTEELAQNIEENQEQIESQKYEFLLNDFENYKQTYDELKDVDINQFNSYKDLPDNLKQIIDAAFVSFINEKENKEIELYEKYSIIGNGEENVDIICHPKAEEMFEEAKKECEQNEIDRIKENVQELEETSKSL